MGKLAHDNKAPGSTDTVISKDCRMTVRAGEKPARTRLYMSIKRRRELLCLLKPKANPGEIGDFGWTR